MKNKNYCSLLAFIFIHWALLLTSLAWGQGQGGLQTSVSVDLAGQWGIGQNAADNRRVYPREAELIFYAPIDPDYSGWLSLAAHQESGQTVFEIHEAFITANQLIKNIRLKFGQYFLGVGRLNRVHRHDWPFFSTPLPHKQFLDDEGLLDSGMELSWLLPLPFFLELNFGFGSGYNFGHSHSAGFKPKIPTLYFRPNIFIEFGNDKAADIGQSHIFRKDQAGQSLYLTGLDFTFKSRKNRTLQFLFQSEVWYRRQNGPTNNDNDLGFYLYPQWGLSERWQIGNRLDFIKGLNHPVLEWALVPNLTYVNSEFSRFRLEYLHHISREDGLQLLEPTISFQATFFLGSHPAHVF